MFLSFFARVRLARALSSRSFALLWFGQTISALGNGAFLTAMAWQVLLLTGSSSLMGVVLVAEMLPQIAFLLLGGVIADRLPRRQVMLWSDSGRFLAVLVIALLGWTHLVQFWQLAALSFFFGLVSSFFSPAYQAIPPQLVTEEDLMSANALTGLSQQVGYLLGPLLGAACVTLIGPPGAFAFDGLTFLLSAMCLLAMRIPTETRTHEPTTASGERSGASSDSPSLSLQTLTRDVREGLDFVRNTPWLWVTIIVSSGVNIGFAGTLQVTLPRLVHDTYGASVWLLGSLTAVGALGSIIASVTVGQMGQFPRRGLIAYLAILIGSIALMIFALPLPRPIEPAAASVAMLLVECGIGVFGILWLTLLQERVPKDKLGRISSIEMLGSYSLLPVGYLTIGILADHFSPDRAFLIGGMINVILIVGGLCFRDIRQLN